MGIVYQLKNEYNKALSCFNECLIFKRKKPGPQPSIAATLYYMGTLYQVKRKLTEALKCYEESLSINRKIISSSVSNNYSQMIVILYNMGVVYQECDENLDDEALNCFEESLRLNRLHGPASNHPSIGDTLNNIGNLHHKKSKLDDAYGCFAESLAIYRESLPAGHARIGITLHNMGSVLQEKHEFDKALLLYKEALEINWTSGQSLESIEITLSNMSSLYQGMVKFDEAWKCYQELLEINQKRCLTSKNNSEILRQKVL